MMAMRMLILTTMKIMSVNALPIVTGLAMDKGIHQTARVRNHAGGGHQAQNHSNFGPDVQAIHVLSSFPCLPSA